MSFGTTASVNKGQRTRGSLFLICRSKAFILHKASALNGFKALMCRYYNLLWIHILTQFPFFKTMFSKSRRFLYRERSGLDLTLKSHLALWSPKALFVMQECRRISKYNTKCHFVMDRYGPKHPVSFVYGLTLSTLVHCCPQWGKLFYLDWWGKWNETKPQCPYSAWPPSCVNAL